MKRKTKRMLAVCLFVMPVLLDSAMAAIQPVTVTAVPVSGRPTLKGYNSLPYYYPGTTGKYWVFPYKGKGTYTVTCRSTSGIFSWDMGGSATPLSTTKTWGDCQGVVALTTNDVSAAVPFILDATNYKALAYLFASNNDSGYEDEGSWPTTLELDYMADLFLTMIGYTAFHKTAVIYRINQTPFDANTLYASEPITRFSLLSTAGMGSGTNSTPKIKDFNFKIIIGDNNHNAAFKYFVVKDWFAGGDVGISTSPGDEVSSGNIAANSVVFESDQKTLTGSVALPSGKLMEGYKGSIPIQFSTTLK